jgi:hypothetical protein
MTNNRKIYKLTEKQIEKINQYNETFIMPTDEEIKKEWQKRHHNKLTGWGMLKANYILKSMKGDIEYQLGLWQGKLDNVCGLEYSEERNEKSYNLGYYRGYNENLNGYLNDVKKTNPNFSFLN